MLITSVAIGTGGVEKRQRDSGCIHRPELTIHLAGAVPNWVRLNDVQGCPVQPVILVARVKRMVMSIVTVRGSPRWRDAPLPASHAWASSIRSVLRQLGEATSRQ